MLEDSTGFGCASRRGVNSPYKYLSGPRLPYILRRHDPLALGPGGPSLTGSLLASLEHALHGDVATVAARHLRDLQEVTLAGAVAPEVGRRPHPAVAHPAVGRLV